MDLLPQGSCPSELTDVYLCTATLSLYCKIFYSLLKHIDGKCIHKYYFYIRACVRVCVHFLHLYNIIRSAVQKVYMWLSVMTCTN